MLNQNVVGNGSKTKRVKGSNILCFVVLGSLILVTRALIQYKSWSRVLGAKVGLLCGNCVVNDKDGHLLL